MSAAVSAPYDDTAQHQCQPTLRRASFSSFISFSFAFVAFIASRSCRRFSNDVRPLVGRNAALGGSQCLPLTRIPCCLVAAGATAGAASVVDISLRFKKQGLYDRGSEGCRRVGALVVVQRVRQAGEATAGTRESRLPKKKSDRKSARRPCKAEGGRATPLVDGAGPSPLCAQSCQSLIRLVCSVRQKPTESGCVTHQISSNVAGEIRV